MVDLMTLVKNDLHNYNYSTSVNKQPTVPKDSTVLAHKWKERGEEWERREGQEGGKGREEERQTDRWYLLVSLSVTGGFTVGGGREKKGKVIVITFVGVSSVDILSVGVSLAGVLSVGVSPLPVGSNRLAVIWPAEKIYKQEQWKNNSQRNGYTTHSRWLRLSENTNSFAILHAIITGLASFCSAQQQTNPGAFWNL